jgi:hypothetical protein
MPKYDPKKLRAGATPKKAPTTFVITSDGGEPEIIEADVFFRGLSLDETAEFPDDTGLKGKEKIEVIKRQLALIVVSIPDFGVGPDEKQKADAEYFGAMEDAHVEAISEAIRKAREIPTRPSSS